MISVIENIYHLETNQYSIHNYSLISMDHSNNEEVEIKELTLVIEIVRGSKSEQIVKYNHT